ncbi:hypothetical protein SAMN02745121_05810 [Nannocystis exedens]|uniref:Uncharacterized protein n=1 Tax=Nannocystis exedens TaxID=54 RepID=A0A1I2DYP3_9BACT|nr:hypothetical protein NAEX_02185 [Nannocystis exedens]SFE85745.1 hypothetical protein SAMN02745121_05810 [Nannocystis exedens]
MPDALPLTHDLRVTAVPARADATSSTAARPLTRPRAHPHLAPQGRRHDHRGSDV